MTTPDDNARIRAAIDLLGGNPSPESLTLLENNKVANTRRFILVIVAAGLFGGAFSYVSGFGRRGRSEALDLPAWLVGLSWVLTVAGIIGAVVLVVGMVRAGMFQRRQNSWLKVLTMEQRRGLVRQIQGKLPLDPEQLPLTLELARTVVRSAPGRWGLLVAVGVLAGNALRSGSWITWVLAVVVTVLAVPGLISSHRQLQRSRALLRDHPQSAAARSADETAQA